MKVNKMCGIIIFKAGDFTASISQVIEIAEKNKHRGQDGIGILYRDMETKKLKLVKNLYTLEEMVKGKLDENVYVKRKTIGSFMYVEEDEDKFKEEQDKFNKYSNKFNDIFSDFIVLHHRKKTAGNKSLKNQHPIFINNKYYIHNGTASEYPSIREYLKTTKNIEFKSETDTEVLAHLYNILKESGKSDDDIFNTFLNMFPNGFGILIEITQDGEVTILKDCSRYLWHYKLEDNGEIFISEPVEDITKVKSLGYVGDGLFKSDNTNEYDYTQNYKYAIEAWDNASSNNLVTFPKLQKCDICSGKKLTISTYYAGVTNPLSKNFDVVKDICLECAIFNAYKDDIKVDEDEQRFAIKKSKYAKRLMNKEKKFKVLEEYA